MDLAGGVGHVLTQTFRVFGRISFIGCNWTDNHKKTLNVCEQGLIRLTCQDSDALFAFFGVVFAAALVLQTQAGVVVIGVQRACGTALLQ